MFYFGCNACKARWGIGEARTCTCEKEKPTREWVGLTDEQIFSIAYDCNALPETITDETLIIFARALWVVFGIKEKNT